jgi:hypothetical protein
MPTVNACSENLRLVPINPHVSTYAPCDGHYNHTFTAVNGSYTKDFYRC